MLRKIIPRPHSRHNDCLICLINITRKEKIMKLTKSGLELKTLVEKEKEKAKA